MKTTGLREWYRQRMLNNTAFVLEHFDEKKGIFAYGDEEPFFYRFCMRTLAFLYKNKVEGNPYFGGKTILEKVERLGDAICDFGEATNDGNLGVEWTPYNMLESIEILGDELGGERKERWSRVIGRHLEDMKKVNNYIYTAPNHFIWRAVLLYRSGKILGNKSWSEFGTFLVHQMMKMQTPDGYWEEAHRGHGPSPNYHRTFLHGLDLYYRESGDEEVREPFFKAIDFAIHSAYPDGMPIDTFDARQPYLSGFEGGVGGNALSRLPEGRRLLRKSLERLDETGVSDARDACGFQTTWLAFNHLDFLLDCYRLVEEGPEAPMPNERDGYKKEFVLSGQEGVGGGCVKRKKAWFIAASAAESDVPRFIKNIFINEHQNCLGIFHDDAGLVVGGGNRRQNHAPLANAVVVTGWCNVDCKAGIFPETIIDNAGKPIDLVHTTEAKHPIQGTYHPIKRVAKLTKNGASIMLDFMHANIKLDVKVIDDMRIAIDYEYTASEIKKLLLQIPVPLFHPARFKIDGAPYEIRDVNNVTSPAVTDNVEVKSRGKSVRYSTGGAAEVFFTHPLETIRYTEAKAINYVPDKRYAPLFTVGLITREFHDTKGHGRLLEIEVS
jgi:hypothetical protein